MLQTKSLGPSISLTYLNKACHDCDRLSELVAWSKTQDTPRKLRYAVGFKEDPVLVGGNPAGLGKWWDQVCLGISTRSQGRRFTPVKAIMAMRLRSVRTDDFTGSSGGNSAELTQSLAKISEY